MIERTGQWMGRHVDASGRYKRDLQRLRKRVRDRRSKYRQRWAETMPRGFMRRHVRAGTAASAEPSPAKAPGELGHFIPVAGSIASPPAPTGAAASAMNVRWLLHVPDGWSRRTPHVTYRRHIVPARNGDTGEFYFYREGP